jgi:hypothetical protein
LNPKDPCAICLEEIEEKGEVSIQVETLKCKHKFHKNCVKEWCKIKSTCPTCRTPIKNRRIPNTLHELELLIDQKENELMNIFGFSGMGDIGQIQNLLNILWIKRDEMKREQEIRELNYSQRELNSQIQEAAVRQAQQAHQARNAQAEAHARRPSLPVLLRHWNDHYQNRYGNLNEELLRQYTNIRTQELKDMLTVFGGLNGLNSASKLYLGYIAYCRYERNLGFEIRQRHLNIYIGNL